MTIDAGGVEFVTREIRCPEPTCHRFLTNSRLPAALGPGSAFSRLQCRSCGKWRWVDLVTGAEYTKA